MPDNDWNTSLYDQKHAFVSEYGKGLLPLLEPRAGEAILDLGCGSGHLAHTIAQSGAHVVGIDSSARMIEAARLAYSDVETLMKGTGIWNTKQLSASLAVDRLVPSTWSRRDCSIS